MACASPLRAVPLGLLLLLMVIPSSAQPEQASEASWFPRILGGGQEFFANSSSRATAGTPPYLPNFSYAGYRWGEEPLPRVQGTTVSVVDYGARPGDGRDDTPAVWDALAAAHRTEGPVVVTFPAGRFIIRDILFIERSHLVLRGEGSDRSTGTELFFPRPLMEVDRPPGYREPGSAGQSPVSWAGGVIWTRTAVEGDAPTLGRVLAGRRGQRMIRLEAPPDVESGDIVTIEWFNRGGEDGSLLSHVYCSAEVSFGTRLYEDPGTPIVHQEVTVVDRHGDWIEVKEPLLHDIRQEWTPRLSRARYLEDVGIEHIRVNFEKKAYPGHHRERGYNALYLTGLAHSWVKDLAVHHVDNGLIASHVKNVTVDGISVTGRAGHHSIKTGAQAYGLLVKNFEIRTEGHIHNPSFDTFSKYNVYTDGTIEQGHLDQHNGANHQNLFDDLEVVYEDSPAELFLNGGSAEWEPRAGAFNTFWNIRVRSRGAETRAVVDPVDDAPYARIVGLQGDPPVEFEYGPEAYIEGTNQPGIAVPSLYQYQLRRRLNGDREPSLAVLSPANGDRVMKGETVRVEATVTHDADRIAKVEFFVDDRKIGEDTGNGPVWRTTWTADRDGASLITARATRKGGGILTSAKDACTGQDNLLWVGERSEFVRSNYPNPFVEQTTIEYALPQTEHVRLELFDVLGRRVKVLVDQVQGNGAYSVTLDAKGLSSGVYFYRIQTRTGQDVGRAVVAR